MANPEKFPYGMCECNGPTCCGGYGPAAFSVVRSGKPMNVCTRCDLPTDTEKKQLVKATDNAELFINYDPIGGLCLALNLESTDAKS